jgi:hypothetical protein
MRCENGACPPQAGKAGPALNSKTGQHILYAIHFYKINTIVNVHFQLTLTFQKK